MDILLSYLFSADNKEAYKEVYAIGLSGMFDSPLYAVGDTVTQILRQQYGETGVTCLMALPPQYFFAAYNQALRKGEGNDVPVPLGESTARTLELLGISVATLQTCIE